MEIVGVDSDCVDATYTVVPSHVTDRTCHTHGLGTLIKNVDPSMIGI